MLPVIVISLSNAEFEEVKSLRSFEVPLASTLKLKTPLREILSTPAESLSVVRKLSDCPRVPKSCFNTYMFCPAWSIVQAQDPVPVLVLKLGSSTGF